MYLTNIKIQYKAKNDTNFVLLFQYFGFKIKVCQRCYFMYLAKLYGPMAEVCYILH